MPNQMQQGNVSSQFCNHCGARLAVNTQFCTKCGARLQTPREREEVMRSIRKQRTCILVLAAAFMLLACVAAAILWFGSQEGTQLIESGDSDDQHVHMWSDATCTVARTCTECGEIKGASLGHAWRDATCTEAGSCSRCGETKGNPLCHAWSDATCAKASTCSRCAMTQGSPLEHNWMRATFLAPKTCSVCSATEGQAIPYQNLDVEAEILRIRAEYNTINANIENNGYAKEKLSEDVTVYWNSDGEVCCAVIYRGAPGIGDASGIYSRTYYFEDGELIFAFYEGADAHRFYFYEGCLMRWRYTKDAVTGQGKTTHDLEFSEEYLQWEKLVLAEAETLP